MSADKGQKTYEEHVAASKLPRRFHKWHRLPSHIRDIFAAGGVKKYRAAQAKKEAAATKKAANAKPAKEKKS